MKTVKESRILKLRRDKGFDSGKEGLVVSIIQKVKEKGDAALLEYTCKYDGVELTSLRVTREKIEESKGKVNSEFLEAITLAKRRIEGFCREQKKSIKNWRKEIDGIVVGEVFTPVEKVGMYVPGGKAPLFSSLLMAAVPAKVAGVSKIILTTPPDRKGEINLHILATASLLGIEEVYSIGGAQAVAAMAWGTETVPRVDKIVGPGNVYVTIAKKLLFGEVGIDMLAGPSEIVVMADERANPEFIARDLLSQLEHGEDTLAVLISSSTQVIDKVAETMNICLSKAAPDTNTSWEENGGLYLVADIEEAVGLANKIAPEHLVLEVANPDKWLPKIRNAGAVFLGDYTPVTLGDYLAGGNHILPTSSSARWASPLGVRDFMKVTDVIYSTKSSLKKYHPFLKTMTKQEGLKEHQSAVDVRVETEDKLPD